MAQEIQEQLFSGWVAQKALIQKEGKVLISLDKTQPNWDIPGGRIHVGENPKEGLARELKEELGVEVAVGEPFYTDFVGPSRFLVVYHATLKNPEEQFTPAADEIAEVRWVGKDEYASLSYWDTYRKLLDTFFQNN
jgi:8-oxo-dGTP pyrophosphatase MutT (NUDIX family)